MNAPLQNLSPDAALTAGALAELASIKLRVAVLESELVNGLAASGPGVFHRLWIDRVANLVATEWGLSVGDLRGSSREKRFTRPRFVWVWLVKHIGHYSYTRTAVECGYVDHTSVIWACGRVDGWREKYEDFRSVTDQLLDIGRAIRSPQPSAPEPATETTAEPGE